MPGFIELTQQQIDVPRFVIYWRSFYTDDDQVYFDNINEGAELSTDNLISLMRWKAQNRFPIAEDFAKAVPPQTINEPRHHDPLSNDEVQSLFESITQHLQDKKLASSNPLIWPVFLCHLAQPESIPVYDVNVWIAWGWVADWIEPKHYKLVPTKLDTYLQFRTWFNALISDFELDPRQLDRALMAFGRFLLSEWGAPLRQSDSV